MRHGGTHHLADGDLFGRHFAENWLSGFANRIHIDFTFVIISGIISMMIALITVSYQSIKAAKENPVKAMRLE